MIKRVILSAALMAASIPTSDELPIVTKPNQLVIKISKKFKVPEAKIENIIRIVDSCVDDSFPCKNDVLAIIQIESSFQEKAKSKVGAAGLMQVLYKKTNTLEENIEAGVWLLKDYHKRLGNIEAAVQAYNLGIGNYRKGMRNKSYYNKYIKAKTEIEDAQT